MDAVRVDLPPLPPDGSIVELTGVRWPEDSYEVLAFLDVPFNVDVKTLDPESDSFAGRFFLYGSGSPRPEHAEGVDIHVRLRLRPRAPIREKPVLTLVVRDAAGNVLPADEVRVGGAHLARP